MSDLAQLLPIILYIFGIMLMIVLIILGLRLLQTLDKIDRILDNVEDKVNTLNGTFNMIKKVTTSVDLISTKIVSGITDNIGKLFKKNKKEDSDYE